MNRIRIEITKCKQCPDFHYGAGHGEDHCNHPKAPYSGDCTITNSIPNECPRVELQYEDMSDKPVVVIVNGYPTSGKDTFCNFADVEYYSHEHSTVDTVKDIAIIMGWDGEKTPKNRDMLSALKDFYVNWFDGTFVEMTELIENKYLLGQEQFIFLHTREPEEIRRVKEWCIQNEKYCYTVFINRDVETNHGNHADANVSKFDYDIYIDNNGTIDEFRKKSLDIFTQMIDNKI